MSSFQNPLIDLKGQMYNAFVNVGLPIVYRVFYDYNGEFLGVDYLKPENVEIEIKIVD